MYYQYNKIATEVLWQELIKTPINDFEQIPVHSQDGEGMVLCEVSEIAAINGCSWTWNLYVTKQKNLVLTCYDAGTMTIEYRIVSLKYGRYDLIPMCGKYELAGAWLKAFNNMLSNHFFGKILDI